MANNRLYIGHTSTKQKVYIGKRMGWGWYGVGENTYEDLTKLFINVAGNHQGNQDGFIIMMEDTTFNPQAFEASCKTDTFKLIGAERNGS